MSENITDQFRDISPHSAHTTYQAGVIAWRKGHPDTVCPFEPARSHGNDNNLRMIWMSGYYEASIYRLLVK